MKQENVTADHIQVPQVWMKNFKNKTPEGDCVFCFNMKTGEIANVKIRTLGTGLNYYIKDFESYLGTYWESPFGRLNKKLIKGINLNYESIDVKITDEEINFLKKFLNLSIGRSKEIQNRILTQTNFKFGIREIAPLSLVNTDPLFNDYNLQFLYNNTNIGFVLPSFTYYYIPQEQEESPIMILSNKIGIRFLKKTENNEINDFIQRHILIIDNEEDIKNYNYCAMITEMATNNDFIIAKNKKDLEILKDGK